MSIKKIGITGGIGSGKTTVCKIFEALGIPIYYADDRAKAIMVEDQQLIEDIQIAFGKESYMDAHLNRKHLAQIVFRDEKQLEILNNIVHPALGRDYINWHSQQKNVPYTLKEAAILFEMGAYKSMDKIITVYAPLELRIQRVIERDGVDRKSVLDRVSKQMDDDEKVKLSDFVVHNDGEQSLVHQVYAIHKKLLKN